jgi:hypothetical protein
MIQVMPNLWVGGQDDLPWAMGSDGKVFDGWYVISAAKEPWHRQALGYTGRGAPKEHPEYLMARRGNRLLLNLVDVEESAYIRPEIIDVAQDDIQAELGKGNKVLIHCNKGGSRAPTIAMLYLAKHGPLAGMMSHEVVEEFTKLYPAYAPAGGMRDFAKNALTPAAAEA